MIFCLFCQFFFFPPLFLFLVTENVKFDNSGHGLFFVTNKFESHGCVAYCIPSPYPPKPSHPLPVTRLPVPENPASGTGPSSPATPGKGEIPPPSAAHVPPSLTIIIWSLFAFPRRCSCKLLLLLSVITIHSRGLLHQWPKQRGGEGGVWLSRSEALPLVPLFSAALHVTDRVFSVELKSQCTAEAPQRRSSWIKESIRPRSTNSFYNEHIAPHVCCTGNSSACLSQSDSGARTIMASLTWPRIWRSLTIQPLNGKRPVSSL